MKLTSTSATITFPSLLLILLLLLHTSHQVSALTLGLILTSTSDSSAALLSALNADNDYTSVTSRYASFASPSLADLQKCDVLLIYTNGAWGNPSSSGQSIAQYIDGGGKVVLANYALSGSDKRSLSGDFAAKYQAIDLSPTCYGTKSSTSVRMSGPNLHPLFGPKNLT
jgi:hypothetical protein